MTDLKVLKESYLILNDTIYFHCKDVRHRYKSYYVLEGSAIFDVDNEPMLDPTFRYTIDASALEMYPLNIQSLSKRKFYDKCFEIIDKF